MADDIPSSRALKAEPLSVLWQALAAPQALMALLGLIALLVLSATVIPQVPPQAREDPQAWLALHGGPFADDTPLLRAFNPFDLYHSFLLRLILALTGVVQVVCMVESVELAWRAAAHRCRPDARGAYRPGCRAETAWTSTLGASSALDLCGRLLAGRGFRLSRLSGDSGGELAGVRRALGLWAQPLAHAGLLAALVGLVVADGWGWQRGDWTPAPGMSLESGRAGTSVRLDRFDLRWAPDGQLRGYDGQVTWFQDGTPIRQAKIAAGRPARLQGSTLRLVGYVPQVRIYGRDQAGRPLVFQEQTAEATRAGSVEIAFPDPEAQPLLFVPDREQYLVLTFDPLGAEGKPVLRLALFRSEYTQSLASAALSQSAAVLLDGLQLDVDLAYRPVLRFAFRPALGLAGGSLILALAVLAAAWIFPAHLVCITAEEIGGATHIRVQSMAVPGGRRSLRELVSELQEVQGNGP